MRGLVSTMVAIRHRKRIVRDFVKDRATNPNGAIPYTPASKAARLFRQLRAFGAIVETTPGRFYLDGLRLGVFRQSARRRRLGWLATIGAAAATAAAATLALTE